MTIPSLTLLSLVLAQDPSPEAAQPRRYDQIELRDGELLEGRIVLERSNYIEIELSPGAVVGFRKSKVKIVRRAAGAEIPRAPDGALSPADCWFVLHDAHGTAVGWLHTTVSTGQDGSSRVQEEWEFMAGRRHFQVTVLETTTPEQQPHSCYFRERISEEILGRKTRVTDERIVEATVDGDVLTVRRLTGDGRGERSLPWPADATFPLLAPAQLVATDEVQEVTVFDPATEDLATRTFAPPRQRHVSVGGKTQLIDEVVEEGAGRRNAVWLDGSARILRREIAGPGLVALPATRPEALRAVQNGQSQPPLFLAEPEGRFGLWRPNPAWQQMPAAPGSLSVSSALHDASITLSLIDHLDRGASLDAAAAAVERWFLLLEPEQIVDSSNHTHVRGRSAVRIAAQAGTGARCSRALLVVVPWQAHFLVLRCKAPASAWDELAPDFEAVIDRLELEPGAVSALLPESERMAAEEAVQPPPAKRRPGSRVRLPSPPK